MATQASIDAIQKLYIAFYQRPADVTGLEYWANRADAANGNMSAIVNAFATSTEATANYGSLNTNQLVNTIYTALFGRAPDAAGLNFYSNAIAAGTMTAGKLALNVLDGATGTDATIIANKLTVAKAYTTAMDTTAEILAYSNATAVTNAKNLLGAVNALDTSVTNATNQIPAVMVSNVNNAAATIAPAGTTFTFTASPLDSFAGNNSGADMVTGTLANIQSTDVVSGGTSLGDTLTVTSAGALNFVVAGTNNAQGVSGFEKLVLADGANTVTLRTNIERTAAVDGNWSTITGGTGYDTVVLTAVTGTAAGAATKTPALVTNTNAINLTTVTGIEQFNATATGGAGGAKTAVLGGAANEQITFSGAGVSGTIVNATATGGAAGTKSVGGAASVTVSLADFVNSLTVIGNTTNGAASAKVAGGVASVVINGGTTVDTITTAAAGNFVFNQVETVNGGAAGGTFTINAGTNTAGSTFNSAANAGAQTITGTAFADVINLSATNGADQINAAGSKVNAIDTITNFRVAADKVSVAGTGVTYAGANTVTTATTVASAATADLAGLITNAVLNSLNAGLSGGAATNWDAAGDAIILNITAGTAAGSYLVVNADGNGTFDAGADIVVKLVGIDASITAANIVG